MESEYEDEFKRDYDQLHKSPPYLRLYEEDEAQAWKLYHLKQDSADQKGDDAASNSNKEELHEWLNLFRVFRFFKSLEGFYKGDLDLSGRSPQRWDSLWRRWCMFSHDFLDVLIDVRSMQSNLEGEELDLEIEKQDSLKAFRTKWRISSYMTWFGIVSHVQEILEYRTKQPIFQKLYLIDLPTEILDMIFAELHVSHTRSLSITCKLLNDISRRCIFQKRTVWFRHPIDWQKQVQTPEDRIKILSETAINCRREMLLYTDFLKNRPDLLDKVESLVLADGWLQDVRYGWFQDFDIFAVEPNFYGPITRAFTDVLSGTRNLITLRLQFIDLSEDIIRLISGLDRLQRLTVMCCDIPLDVTHALEAGILSTSSVPNLTWRSQVEGANSETQWYTLLLCPTLLTLAIKSFGESPLPPLLPPEIWPRFVFLQTLQRLDVDASWDFHELAELLQVHAQAHPLRLTHFRISSPQGIEPDTINQILSALRGCPMEVLVLQGIAGGDPLLIQHISDLFPDLIALTLILRQNNRQRRNKYAIWPCPSWEYSARFGGFRRLKHFAWNFYLNISDSSPRTMLLFEDDFTGIMKGEDKINWDRWREERANMFFTDNEYLALSFAAHCPTLETFGITSGDSFTFRMACRISRASGGTPILTVPPARAFQQPSSWKMEQWNTDEFAENPGWPPILI
ncbi:hypothetical protein M422DRAFT_269428 [Sphaerobolus stellatus SS14]|uniref:F-box domain-containing protein n=1 Tax=Sphaerobolus stellatus (strain SS14) TaxID=990650 RepID=A0A0C9TI86_SPHS4|nr:hypothetical protein M422DRAFT_269428 [Sphaerobolus stellatus SS14]